MATGFLAVNICYASQAEALDAFYSSQSISTHTGSTSAIYFRHRPAKNLSSWYDLTERCTVAGTSQSCTSVTKLARTDMIGVCTIPDPTTYDYNTLGQVWAFAVSVILLAYVLGRSAGLVISVFRK